MSGQEELFDPMAADVEDLLKHIDDVKDDPRAWPASLAELVDVLADDAMGRGRDESGAFSEARRTITLIAHHWGARMCYMPRNDKLKIALRDNQIYRQFRGNNITVLAIKHGLTDMQIYNIIAHQRRLTVKRKQRPLFPDSERY